MKLRTQILCLGLAGAALVSAAGGIGLLAVSSTTPCAATPSAPCSRR
jgi:hypothetical protein